MYVHVYVYIFVCICIYIHIYIYVFIFCMLPCTQHVELRFLEHAYTCTTYMHARRTQILQGQRESWGDGASVRGGARGCEGQGLFAG